MKKFVLIVLTLLLLLAVPAVQADLFYFGNVSINYNAAEVPFYQWQIEQGAAVYQGRVYDIRGAIGTSDSIAHWKNWKEEDNTCSPDVIIPVRYIESGGSISPSNFYIDPSIMPTGNYFQWDGCRQFTVLEKQPNGEFKSITKNEQAPRENRFAFTVKAPQKPATIALISTQAIPIYTLPYYAMPAQAYDEVSEDVFVTSEPVKKEEPWYITYWWALIIVCVLIFIFREDIMDTIDDLI